MNKEYRCDFIYCASFTDKDMMEYYLDDTLSDITIEADNLRNLLFGLIHFSNDYTQENYKTDNYRKCIRAIDGEEFILPSELTIKGITIEKVLNIEEL